MLLRDAPWLPITRKPSGFELTEALGFLPGEWREAARAKHGGYKNHRTGNKWLLDTVTAAAEIKVPITVTDTDLADLARKNAFTCMGLASLVHDKRSIRERMAGYCIRYGIEPPLDDVRLDTVTGELVQKGIQDDGAIRRMTDSAWWRKALRKAQGRAIEGVAIRLGMVHRNAELYASDLTTDRRQQQKRRNLKALQDTEAENRDTGQTFTLYELAARSVANPAIRRGELMTRISGFESVAKALGHIGLFVTVTCPSRMHKKGSGGGKVWDNPKYDGTTPREAARYLSGMWAKARAAMHRAGIRAYGFRIAEPHHDGTPHWHLLMFCPAEFKAGFCRIFCKYARQENREELKSKKAKAARFLVKLIDWSRGTAAGYVAKYVSKNIDGYQVQTDLEGAGHDAVTGSQRVEAWAAAWGIRQFQQIGGPTVGVWRELRRMACCDSETVESAREAAGEKDSDKKADWGRYVEIMGGPTVSRIDMPLKVAKTREGERWNFAEQCPEPAPLTRYAEVAPGAVYGVLDCAKGRAYQSRRYRWEIKRGGAARLPSADGSRAGDQQRSASPFGFEVGRPASPVGPWSPVNNCTAKPWEGVEGKNGEAIRNDACGGAESEIQDSRRAERPARADDSGAYPQNFDRPSRIDLSDNRSDRRTSAGDFGR